VDVGVVVVVVGVLVVVVVEVVPVVVVGVVVVGGVTRGTRSVARKFLLILSGGSTRSTSWIRLARTVMRHTVPAASVRFGVSVNREAGDELNENRNGRPLGHANTNERRVARTRSLNRTDNTPADDNDTELTRGARSAEADNGTRPANHEPPPATDTPAASPSGAASSTTTTLHQRLCKRRPLPR
jgi:hypothetical protein